MDWSEAEFVEPDTAQIIVARIHERYDEYLYRGYSYAVLQSSIEEDKEAGRHTSAAIRAIKVKGAAVEKARTPDSRQRRKNRRDAEARRRDWNNGRNY